MSGWTEWINNNVIDDTKSNEQDEEPLPESWASKGFGVKVILVYFVFLIIMCMAKPINQFTGETAGCYSGKRKVLLVQPSYTIL